MVNIIKDKRRKKMSLKNLMKKALSFSLAAAMLTACSGGGSASGGESGSSEGGDSGKGHKIAILEVQLNDESTNRAEYFKNYIGPEYNVEFMFSEAIQDLDAALSFLENAADAGCEAVINYYPIGANTEQLVQKAAELGLVFTENGGRNADNDDTYKAAYDNFSGGFMADQPDTGRLFKEWMEENIDTSVEHGYLIATGMAYQGNAQQTEISSNMLAALEELYGLKFDLTKEELYQSSSPIEGTNDKGVPVYCYPGGPNQNGWLEGFTAALQTGKYDYILTSPNVIGNIGTAISELETAMNKDFTWIGFGTFGDALKTAIGTKDSFGNQTLAMSTVKFTSIVSAMAFAKVYNTLTGHNDVNLENGETSVNLFRMNSVTTPEQLDEMSTWDQPGKWVADIDFVNSLIAERGGASTNEEFQNNIYKYDFDAISAKMK